MPEGTATLCGIGAEYTSTVRAREQHPPLVTPVHIHGKQNLLHGIGEQAIGGFHMQINAMSVQAKL
jgi:hypothetical protein